MRPPIDGEKYYFLQPVPDLVDGHVLIRDLEAGGDPDAIDADVHNTKYAEDSPSYLGHLLLVEGEQRNPVDDDLANALNLMGEC